MVLRHIKHSSPAWWRAEHAGPEADILSPFSWAYNKVTRTKDAISRTYKAAVPVICVGNFTMGGAGKTPVVIYLTKYLQKKGLNPAIITRGYLGKERGPIKADKLEHSAKDVGDEALLLSQYAPTIVSKNRAKGAWLVEHRKNDFIILDDGFQNPSLHKDLNLIVVDSLDPVGNGKVFPAGPLRADLAAQLDKVDAIILSGFNGDDAPVDAVLEILEEHDALSIPVLLGRIHPQFDPKLKDKPLLAFSGIGKPEKFFKTLEELGANIAKTRSFADHHYYSKKDAEILLDEARRKGWTLITTEKDWVRIPTDETHVHRALKRLSHTLPITFQFEKEADKELEEIINQVTS